MNISEFGYNKNSTDFICPFEDTRLVRDLKIFAIIVAGGFGILNNVFIIVLALKYTTTKNLHHLIINMAAADILTVLMMSGLKLPSILDRDIWSDIKTISGGDIVCKVLSFLVVTSMNVSYSSLVIICIERFRASRKTMHLLQPYTLNQRIAIVAFSWLISGALTAHEIPYRAVKDSPTGPYACKLDSKVPIVFRIFYYSTLATSYFCIIILSVMTLRKISYRREIEGSLSEVQRKIRAKRISGAIKMDLETFMDTNDDDDDDDDDDNDDDDNQNDDPNRINIKSNTTNNLSL
ncbi:Gastrin/cholecystokinin type B receptor [Exaiptasia diaphana]|nr:Gastrin/cholecystokinin type B receptor [Exaiptasia diaphana]